MARHKSAYLGTIEYIGPRPKKAPKRPNFLAGWVVLLIAAGGVYFIGKPLMMPLAKAQENVASVENTAVAIQQLQDEGTFGSRLAAAALSRTQETVQYEDSYFQIAYPQGDVPADKGKAEDVIVRSYRKVGVDLQQRVHEDMEEHFSEYPQIFGRRAADSNIDHRMTRNLERFFQRKGAEITVMDPLGNRVPSRNVGDYEVGDVVAWRFSDSGRSHIGIVVPGPGDAFGERWIVHNAGNGPVWESCLFNYKITGHFRYQPEMSESSSQ
ncbi:hypothetical protein HNR46_003169 [Haloferula luteola]|uniref:DUF1287 domain-containing protein n=1 Tax=Haloferula luteola TaxID=595692 RepID=A0A840VGG2_9BACT|nr:DUF1287 domain-containing protein [Haloferula luteola]MBB5352920.1 hypothetical protein [Haloferula luteola]